MTKLKKNCLFWKYHTVADYNNPKMNKSMARHLPTVSVFLADFKNITLEAVRFIISDCH